MQKYKLILFGGDRLLEGGPLSKLCFFLKKNKIKFLIFTEEEHLKKKVNCYKSFKQVLDENKFQYISKKKIKAFHLRKYISKNTFGLSINSIWKFNKDIIKLFQERLYNYHAADLPSERGAAAISWRILMKKNRNTSINIHQVEKEYDTGSIVSSKKIILPINAKLPFEYLSIIQKNEKTFLEKFVVNLLKKKKIVKSIQPSHNSFYWPRLNADVDGLINWTWQADEIISFIRAFSKPYNGAYSFLKGNKIRIFNAYKIKTSQKFHSFQSGIIFRYYKNFFYVAVKEYALKILSSDIYGLNEDHSYYLGKRFLDE